MSSSSFSSRLVLGGFLFAVSPAPAGGISGVVTNSEGAGLNGICVSADGATGSGIAITDVFGRYTVEPLYTDKYAVRFNDCGRHNVAIEWYKNATSYRKAKPVKAKLRFRKSGKIKVRFRVSSVTGGGVKTVKEWVRVRG